MVSLLKNIIKKRTIKRRFILNYEKIIDVNDHKGNNHNHLFLLLI